MKKILIVDDDKNLLHSYRRLFFSLRNQIKVIFESDPEKALERVKEERFDLVLCDLLMPVIKGDRILEAVFLHFPETRKVLISGEEQDVLIEDARHIDFLLHKPCPFEEIKALIGGFI